MELEIGSILTGKVVTVTKFGAFVSVAPNKSGLVHISEIANTFVREVTDFVNIGQEVRVKVLSIDEHGRINLSIKQAQENGQSQPRRNGPPPFQRSSAPRGDARPSRGPAMGSVTETSGDSAFEDKLKRFMQDSESKISGSRQYADRRVSRRRGNRGGGGDY